MSSVNDVQLDWPDPKPRLVVAPDCDSLDDANDAIDLAASAGLVLDAWQRATLRLMMARKDGQWAAFEAGLMVGRQNGKGSILEARELASLFLLGDKRVIHTSHRQETSIDHFKRMVQLVESSRDFEQYVKRVSYSNGSEGIYLKDGREMVFRTRYRGGGRGLSNTGLLVFDEAMILQHASVADLMDTMTVAPDPQAIYTGTAGKDGDPDSLVFGALRDRAIAGDDRRFAWAEWTGALPDDHTGEKVNLDDRDAWYRGNPSPRVSEEFIEVERNSAATGDEEFGRERLCLWWTGRRISVLDPDRWQKLTVKSKPGDKKVFAVDVPPERDSASIAVASPLDGKWHIELVDHRPGTAWVVPRLVELDEKHKPEQIAILRSSPAGSLIQEIGEALEKERVPVLKVSEREYPLACGQFLSRFTEDAGDPPGPQLAIHKGPHIGVLTEAVDAAHKREFTEGGFVWNRKDTAANIAPLVAMTLALYATGVEPKKRRKKRTQNPF